MHDNTLSGHGVDFLPNLNFTETGSRTFLIIIRCIAVAGLKGLGAVAREEESRVKPPLHSFIQQEWRTAFPFQGRHSL